MENNTRMNRMAEDMKAFQHMKSKERNERNEKQVLDAVFTDDDLTPSDILMKASEMLLETSLMVAKASFLVGFMEDEDEDEKDDSVDDIACGDCPYYDDGCMRSTKMVLVVRPHGDNTIMTMNELAEEIGNIFEGQTGSYDMHPIPGTEDLYYVIPEKKPLKRSGKAYYKAPAVIFGIDEDAGEVVSPDTMQLYTAARYFEDHATTIKTREGDVSVFCFD